MKRGLRGEPELDKWDNDGACTPDNRPWPRGEKTFSVGIFQWVAASKGKLKRGKVVCRVKGLTSEPEMVYEMAEKICRAADLFGKPSRKSYTAERRVK